MNKKIGKFTLGGMPWKIVIDNSTCNINGSSWVRWLPKQIVGVTDEQGVKLNYDSIERNIWHSIFFIIFNDYMEYRDLDIPKTYSFSLLLKQGLDTMTSKPGEWDGSFNLGCISYIVKVNNIGGRMNGYYGQCNPNSKIIEIVTENTPEEIYNDEFIMQTLIHEMLHAINFELGLEEDIMNSEKFVNTASTFIYEVYKTLKIKFPDE